jgi:hypothetical protein
MRPDSALDREIADAARIFKAEYHQLIAETTRATHEQYEAECRIAVSRLMVDAPLLAAGDGRRALHSYLAWLSWVFWNAVNLVPLTDSPEAASRRLAISALAYCGGRLVDDGLDGHLDFKSHQTTFLGALIGDGRDDEMQRSSATSVLTGMLLFAHAMSRLRSIGDAALALRLERLMLASGVGALAERRAPNRVTASVYWAIVRRKCIDYNMMLYSAMLCGASRDERRSVLRPLADLDSMAQLLNDLGDRDDDRNSGRLNAFADGVFRVEDATALLAARRQRTWMRVGGTSARVRGVVAVMLDHLGSPQARPSGRLPGLARRLDRGVAAGLHYLAAVQMEHGEFATYWSATRNLGLVPEYKSSPFVTALTLFCLAEAKECPVDRRRSLRFLAGRRDPTGLLRFFEEGIDPDLDDTALVNYVLMVHQFDRWPYRALARRLAAIERRRGLFPTWIRSGLNAPNDVDPCVTANVLRFLGAMQVPADDAWAALRRAVLDAAEGKGTLYYESPAALPFFAATLPIELRRRVLQPEELSHLAHSLVDRFSADCHRSPIDVAMTLSVAAAAGVGVAARDELSRSLLDWQTDGGGWPAWAVFRAFNYWGSPALTTALAIHALLSHRAAGA